MAWVLGVFCLGIPPAGASEVSLEVAGLPIETGGWLDALVETRAALELAIVLVPLADPSIAEGPMLLLALGGRELVPGLYVDDCAAGPPCSPGVFEIGVIERSPVGTLTRLRVDLEIFASPLGEVRGTLDFVRDPDRPSLSSPHLGHLISAQQGIIGITVVDLTISNQVTPRPADPPPGEMPGLVPGEHFDPLGGVNAASSERSEPPEGDAPPPQQSIVGAISFMFVQPPAAEPRGSSSDPVQPAWAASPRSQALAEAAPPTVTAEAPLAAPEPIPLDPIPLPIHSVLARTGPARDPGDTATTCEDPRAPTSSAPHRGEEPPGPSIAPPLERAGFLGWLLTRWALLLEWLRGVGGMP